MTKGREEAEGVAMATYMSLQKALWQLNTLLDGFAQGRYGLSPSQVRLLEHLLIFGAKPTGEVARGILFGDSTISVVSRNLQRAGLVVRWAHETDGRKAMVGLAPKGLKLTQELLLQRATLVRARMAVLTKAQQENLQRICRNLAEGDEAKFSTELSLGQRVQGP